MRVASPTSRTGFRLRLCAVDVFWAVTAPFLALALRDPGLLDLGDFQNGVPETYQFALVATACALAAFLFFRLSDSMGCFFSVQDALVVCVAVASAVASSSVITFTFTRLDHIPRSTPVILGLVLGAGLIVSRAAARVFYKEVWADRELGHDRGRPANLRRVIIIGVDRFASIAIKLTDYQRPRTTQVVAALDSRSSIIGRKISGVQIVGFLGDLQSVIDEYAVHGVHVDEVWLSDKFSLVPEGFRLMEEQCGARNIRFVRISEAFNLPTPEAPRSTTCVEGEGGLILSDYFALKRILDITAAAALLVALSPIAAFVAGMTLFDVGAPILFWQERVGRSGRKFSLYKFRTYHAPFDKEGRRIPEEKRLSRIGRAIRASRLDEIPQLYNVLVGDMSLIGPRPLLPHDQPGDPRLRLLVRPGITGWAQINGGTIVTPDQKDALDVWYIRHVSLWLDLKIGFRTLLVALTGEKMNNSAVEHAIRWRGQHFRLSDAAVDDAASFGPGIDSRAREASVS
jgi:lipopolysaccharide/colanic/teichoic acid biosynthesis glycosyltransferase